MWKQDILSRPAKESQVLLDIDVLPKAKTIIISCHHSICDGVSIGESAGTLICFPVCYILVVKQLILGQFCQYLNTYKSIEETKGMKSKGPWQPSARNLICSSFKYPIVVEIFRALMKFTQLIFGSLLASKFPRTQHTLFHNIETQNLSILKVK